MLHICNRLTGADTEGNTFTSSISRQSSSSPEVRKAPKSCVVNQDVNATHFALISVNKRPIDEVSEIRLLNHYAGRVIEGVGERAQSVKRRAANTRA